MARLDIGEIKSHFKTKDRMIKMIDKLGKEESVRRVAWLYDYDEDEDKVSKLFDQFLTDDYVDDKGVKGGDYFWGDL